MPKQKQSPEKKCGPVAQSGQSGGLLIRRSRVQFPSGPPLNMRSPNQTISRLLPILKSKFLWLDVDSDAFFTDDVMG
jgi:hypothetical protein